MLSRLRKSPVRQFYGLLSALYLAGLFLILWKPETEQGKYTSFCLFRNITGIPCPGCGMGRGVVHFFRMELQESFDSHPLAIPVTFLILIIPIWISWDLATRKAGLYHFLQSFDGFMNRNRIVFWLMMFLFLLLWSFNIYKFQHYHL